MDALRDEHEHLYQDEGLAKGLEDVQKTIDLLMNARSAIAAGKVTFLVLVSILHELVPF